MSLFYKKDIFNLVPTTCFKKRQVGPMFTTVLHQLFFKKKKKKRLNICELRRPFFLRLRMWNVDSIRPNILILFSCSQLWVSFVLCLISWCLQMFQCVMSWDFRLTSSVDSSSSKDAVTMLVWHDVVWNCLSEIWKANLQKDMVWMATYVALQNQAPIPSLMLDFEVCTDQKSEGSSRP